MVRCYCHASELQYEWHAIPAHPALLLKLEVGPAMRRSLLRSIESCQISKAKLAYLSIPTLYSDMLMIYSELSQLLPVRHLMHPMLIASLRSHVPSIASVAESFKLKSLREAARRLNIAAAIAKEVLENVPVTAPPDIKNLRMQQDMTEQQLRKHFLTVKAARSKLQERCR